MQLPNLLTNLPSACEREQYETLLAGQQFRLERIVSAGQTTPPNDWYDQDEEEWVLLLAGEAELEFDNDKRIRLLPGDRVRIPAHCRHRVSHTSATETTVWLALFFSPVEMPKLA
jgi:cupin 2 domain-containing protein